MERATIRMQEPAPPAPLLSVANTKAKRDKKDRKDKKDKKQKTKKKKEGTDLGPPSAGVTAPVELRQLVSATQELREISSQFTQERGALRDEVAMLRAALVGAIGSECAQLALPPTAIGEGSGNSGEGAKPIYIRRLQYRTARTINPRVVEDACTRAFRMQQPDMSHPQWRKQVKEKITERVRELTVSKKEYVDVTERPMQKSKRATQQASGVQRQANPVEDTTAVEIARELHTAKTKLSTLKKRETAALASPKRRVARLSSAAAGHIKATTRVRVPSGDSHTPDSFVAQKLHVRKKKLTMRCFGEVLEAALAQLDDGCTAQDITRGVLATLNTWNNMHETESDVIRVDRGSK